MSIYSDYTKAELLAAIDEKGCSNLIATFARYPAKPTNDELVAVLDAFDLGQTAETVANDVASIKSEPVLSTPEPLTQEDQMWLTTELMIPVVVTDYDTSVSTEENIENKVFRGSCGNLITGTLSFAVGLHGRMQYLPKIVIDHLRSIRMTSNYKNAAGAEVSDTSRLRFNVTEVEGWTEAELAAHAQEQALKKVSSNS